MFTCFYICLLDTTYTLFFTCFYIYLDVVFSLYLGRCPPKLTQTHNIPHFSMTIHDFPCFSIQEPHPICRSPINFSVVNYIFHSDYITIFPYLHDLLGGSTPPSPRHPRHPRHCRRSESNCTRVALKRRDKARSFKDSSETTPVTFHSDETD